MTTISEGVEKKNIIVTGGAGFIGSHLCERLVQNHQVICVDNFLTGSQENISHLLTHPNFELIKHSIEEPLDLDRFPELERFQVKTFGVQQVYHLACPTSPKQFDEFRIATLDASGIGTKNALELAWKYRASFLLASSAVVYGQRGQKTDPFSEEYLGEVDPVGPRACYDEGKRFSETQASTYAQVFGLDVKIARIFRTYGPRLRLFDGQMIPDFILSATENTDLVIYGDESFSTALLYVDDLTDGLIRLMESDEKRPVNFGGMESYVLSEIGKTILEMTKSSSKIVYDKPLTFMTPLGIPDISRAKETLGWVPVTRLEEGLQKTIDYVNANKALIKKRYTLS